MLFNSLEFLIFFPIVAILYYLIPAKYRYIWLLVSSYYFYMCWNVLYSLILLGATIVTYCCGLLLQKFSDVDASDRKKKMVLAVSCVLNLSVLFVFKYSDFIIENMQRVLNRVNINVSIPRVSLLLPVGISFYLFQAIGYTIDVYRKTIRAERNFLKYALFVSFFPQLVAGPIERSSNLLPQFEEVHEFDLQKIKDNLVLMGWGLFMKIVIADRIAILVDTVYGNLYVYGGWYIIIATILFAFQIYCDFAGYTTIAIGAAGVMGFRLMDNFKSPYCAVTVKDFWGRWHISLTGWFRDYLYIPLGGNRKGKIRKYLNQIIVFLVSGLWHGAMWSYVVWGGINGLYLVLGDIFAPIRAKIREKLKYDNSTWGDRAFQVVITFIMVDFSWIFFRARGTKEAMLAIRSIFEVKNVGILFDGSLYSLGLDIRNFWFMIVSLVLLFAVDELHYYGFSFREWLKKQNLWFRWICYLSLIGMIVVFGIWGAGYDSTAFIYFQF